MGFIAALSRAKSAVKCHAMLRRMSNVPESTVYGGPKPQNPNQRVTLTHLKQKHRKGEPITVVTAYDYPSAVQPHQLFEFLPLVLGLDLFAAGRYIEPYFIRNSPFLNCYDHVDIRLVLKQFKIVWKVLEEDVIAYFMVEVNQSLEALHLVRSRFKLITLAFSPLPLWWALHNSKSKLFPVKIMAYLLYLFMFHYNETSSLMQVLVYHDLLGMLQHPHHAKVTPKFCKQYANVGDVINEALLEYKEEVTNGSFPGPVHSPYKISASDIDGFLNELQKLGLDKAASAAAEASEKIGTA
ncbi:hypothetical protein FH972_003872 [Carpinus fangiana]|uniref:3-methyl-2-oxobutanoate hydroxymethyltransferase n=1 Tax=Carpinus fangiana TaxID=176857 RepID=A0A5N6QLA7_9ROSI|nr:hypothetical protein FH972_003872 [Carpinus fangiana]